MKDGNLPEQVIDFSGLRLKTFKDSMDVLYAVAKESPDLYIKERSLEKARRVENMARAVQAKEAAAYSGKVVVLIEKDIADSNPAIPHKEHGAMKGKKEVAPDATSFPKYKLSKIRKAYEGLSAQEVADQADQAIKEDKIPTRNMFLLQQKQERSRIAVARRDEKEAAPKSNDCKLYTVGCAHMTDKVEEGSVDLILTDPPYPREHLNCFSLLSFFAGHALREGGSLLCMSGQTYLPEVLERLNESARMYYEWTLSFFLPGAKYQPFHKKIFSNWKPVLWFVKGDYGDKRVKFEGEMVHDTVRGDTSFKQDKKFHKWWQQESGMFELLKRFAFPGDVVCDPFLGGGTTAVVARHRGCRFIGSDIDPECIKITKERLNEAKI